MGTLRQAFSEDGSVSSMRVMSFMTLLYIFFIFTYTIVKGQPLGFEYFTALLVAAFCPKMVQKFGERNGKNGNGKAVTP